VPIGWLTPWGLKSLITRAGLVRARNLCFCLEPLSGSEALRIGIADYLTEDGGALVSCRGLIRGGEKDVASRQSLSLKLSAIVSTSAAALRFRPAEALPFAPTSDASSATPSIISIALCFAITPSSTSKWIRLSHSIRAISHWGSEDCITASLRYGKLVIARQVATITLEI
jgi:hypothetical protein